MAKRGGAALSEISPVSVTAELVTKLYEAAVKKVPNSEEYHSHLFMAYARVGEYKKMQQVSGPAGTATRAVRLVMCFSCAWKRELGLCSPVALLASFRERQKRAEILE